MAKDRGVPNWRDATAYPDPEQTTMREWWWEFTRRRPEYRELWDGADEVPGHDYRYAPDVDEFRLKFELSVIRDPAQRFTDWQLMQYRYPRNFAQSPRELLLEQADHPLIDTAFARATHRGRLAEEKGNVLYNFDLSRPLPAQIEQAAEYLKAVQLEVSGKVIRRPRTGNWREFLQAIDARDAGATYREMCDVFWPCRSERKDGKEEKTDHSARDTYDAACRLRDNFPI